MAKTRKEHICEVCKKVIPKGTLTNEIIIESAGGTVPHYHTLGSHHDAFSYWGYRRYYHKDCYIMKEICEKKKPFSEDFHVLRNTTEVVYLISGNEIVIPLTKDNSIESWNKAVEKDNMIYEFARVNGLTMYPELKLKAMMERD